MMISKINKIKIMYLFVAIIMNPATSIGQLVSVKCCVQDEDLAQIGHCLSGPDDSQSPDQCPSAGFCILGFGEEITNIPGVKLSDRDIPTDDTRADCSSWVDDRFPVITEQVVTLDTNINLFNTFDFNGDEDVDMKDLSVFVDVYQPQPKLVQSEASIVFMECCLSDFEIRNIGNCLSGPNVAHPDGICDSGISCSVGFSEAVQFGDRLYNLCQSEVLPSPLPIDAICSVWENMDIQSVQTCSTKPIPGVNPFVLYDADGDDDLDLMDYAEFQRNVQLP